MALFLIKKYMNKSNIRLITIICITLKINFQDRMESKFQSVLNPLSISIEEQNYKDKKRYRFKIIIMGDGNVGKSSILYQYTRKQDPSFQSPTIGSDFSSKVIHYNDIQIHLQIWDLAGRQKNQSVPNNLFSGVVGIILVYDVSNKVSFRKMEQYWDKIVEKGEQNKEIMLIGNIKLNHQNQIIKQRQVSHDDGFSFANRRRIQFRQISASKNNKVNEIFHDLVKGIIYKVENQIIPENVVSYGMNDSKKNIKLSHRDILSERRYNRCC